MRDKPDQAEAMILNWGHITPEGENRETNEFLYVYNHELRYYQARTGYITLQCYQKPLQKFQQHRYSITRPILGSQNWVKDRSFPVH